MNKIKILSSHEAQKIAAGEVVERPAHILKELLENAIDAGASQISIYIEDAGKTSMRIVDNGSGMSQDDIRLCVAAHATSKITTVDELSAVMTYGFRGEALASVAAVSRLTITSRDEACAHGWQVRFEQGIVIHEAGVASEQGTTIEVRDLFYNIPVRKKFLKQNETEWNQLQQLVYAFTFSCLNISFKLYRDDRLVLQAPAVKNLHDRAAQIWGLSTAQQFLSINQSEPQANVQLEGIVTSHQSWRYGKHQIFFFVNKRWIKDVELVKALCKGYNNVLPPGKFPAGVIIVNVDPTTVDINVHPKKEEIRFTKPQIIATAVIQAVQNVLRLPFEADHGVQAEQNDLSRPDIFNQSLKEKQHFTPEQSTQELGVVSYQDTEQDSTEVEHKTDYHKPTQRIVIDDIAGSSWPKKIMPRPAFTALGTIFTQDQIAAQSLSNESMTIFDSNLVGQILNTYIILDHHDGMILIDQHAAHERVLYERMKNSMVARESSLLLFPRVLTLPNPEIVALERFEQLLVDFGIVCDHMGNQTVAIKAVPLGVAQIDLEDLLRQVAALVLEHDYVEHEVVQKMLYEHVHSHLACKKAVKAGDVLTVEQMQNLIKDLKTVEKPFICIHGRPTYWQLAKSQIEKFFRR